MSGTTKEAPPPKKKDSPGGDPASLKLTTDKTATGVKSREAAE